MVLPPPLIVTLNAGLSTAEKTKIMTRINELDGVIQARPRDASGRELTVIFVPGAKIEDELRRMDGIAGFREAPPPAGAPRRPPSP